MVIQITLTFDEDENYYGKQIENKLLASSESCEHVQGKMKQVYFNIRINRKKMNNKVHHTSL